ncbi:MAG: divalent metal cation transporter [Proteobacteria bacterium]|nr:divalent metal cation transporter [Pseudomonadota bacterium]
MVAVQLICADIGRVTGRGIAGNIKAAFPPVVLYGVVLMLLVANTLNIAADVAAMGEAIGLVTGFDRHTFFWQASEEVEEMGIRGGESPLGGDWAEARRELRRIEWDTWSGMFYSNLAAHFIILATGVTLNVAGVTTIDTAARATSALRPLAGNLAYLLFTLGIIGVGLIGVPVLAGSSGYAAAEAFGWRGGLERKLRDAPGFYAVIAGSVLAGLFIQYAPISPMRAQFWSAVINGVVAVPLIAMIVVLVSGKSVMGEYTASRPVIALGWIAPVVTGAAAVFMLVPG